MEKFRLPHISESVRVMNEACRRLIGPHSEEVRKMSYEALNTARVTHEKESHNAQNRRTHHKRNSDSDRRKVGPSSGMSLIRALNQVVELREQRLLAEPGGYPMALPPQARRDSYTLAVMSAARNTDSAIITVMMMLHDYTLPEAREVYELLMQDRSRGKADSKFYGKRTALNIALKERFEPTNGFLLEPSGKEIQTGPLSESEADENYAFQELIAGLLGQPIFTERFDPHKPIPKLASSGRNGDDDIVEAHRIAELLRPSSFDKIIESLEYTTMKQKAKGPVLNDIFRDNGHSNNGTHNPPATETQIQEDIAAVIDNYVDSNKFRCQLKYPDLEVVVDGALMSAPFAAISACHRRFKLPGFARYVQVFATENNRRTIISNLILPDSDIATGETWHSQLQLEGRQVVTLTVEPELDNLGNLAGSSLFVSYQPSIPVFTRIFNQAKDLWATGQELWPAWLTKPVFASILGGIFLAPLITIKVFSVPAPIILASSLTAYLILVGKIRPKWGVVRLQHLATDAFMSLMLVAMLLFGLLPIGPLSQPATSSVDDRPAVENVYPHQMLTEVGSLHFASHLMLDPTVAISKPGNGLPAAEKAEIVEPSSNQVQPEINTNEAARLAQSKTTRAHSRRSPIQGEVFHVEVLVDTKQMIPLIGNDSTFADTLALRTSNNQITVMKVLDTGNAQGTLVGNSVASASDKPNGAEQASGSVAQPSTAVATPQTPAWVVFDSPTQLGSLNKGDVLNANFKPIVISNASVLECSATGVVQDIKRRGGANVEIRIGLSLTWVHDGNTVNSKLDLLLTDFSRGKENSHYGILTIPQPEVASSIAKFESRLRKP